MLAFCEEPKVKIAGAWIPRDDPDDEDLDTAFQVSQPKRPDTTAPLGRSCGSQLLPEPPSPQFSKPPPSAL